MWLTGRLAPDFKTIADFRHDNGAGIRNVCRRFVELCRELKLFSQAVVAIDGSKFKAVNSRDRNFTPGKIAEAQAADRREHPALPRRARYRRPDAARRSSRPRQSVCRTRSRRCASRCAAWTSIEGAAQARARRAALADRSRRALDDVAGQGHGVVGYNVQTAVDAKHHLIVAHEVTNIGSDRAQLQQDGAGRTRGDGQAEAAGATPIAATSAARRSRPATTRASRRFVPKPMTSNAKAEGRFDKSDFIYIAKRRRVPVPGRAACHLPLHPRGRRSADPALLDAAPARRCPIEGAVHAERLPTHLALGTRGRARGDAAPARSASPRR